jgi:radical SAM enzyme (TIGR01210 family)
VSEQSCHVGIFVKESIMSDNSADVLIQLSTGGRTKERLQGEIRNYMKEIRHRARRRSGASPPPWRTDRVNFTESRQGYLNGAYVDRLVVYLRGSGCAWTAQTGGCTFCGFWDATRFGSKIDDADIVAQLQAVIDDPSVELERYPIVCLYNDGSMLVDREVGLDAVAEMCSMLSARPHIGRIVLEAKAIDITKPKVEKLLQVLRGRELEIAVGFESANPLVRDLCVNKTLRTEVFEANCRMLAREGASLVPLLIVKPPFLTEAQAVDDMVKSLAYLETLELCRIDLQPATVESDTLTCDLWECGLYSPPWLWSLIEILQRRERLGLRTQLFVSPPNYSVPSLAVPSNCLQCDARVVEAIESYNRTGAARVFDGIDCACREAWQRALTEGARDPSLLDQVGRIFSELQRQKGSHENCCPSDGALAQQLSARAL